MTASSGNRPPALDPWDEPRRSQPIEQPSKQPAFTPQRLIDGPDDPQHYPPTYSIPVFQTRYVKSYPVAETEPDPIAYTDITEAMQTEYDSDAHFAAYTHPKPHRLNSQAATPHEPPAMHLLVVDVDAHDDGTDVQAWRAQLKRSSRTLPGEPFGYFTKRGARLLWRIKPFAVTGADAAKQWSIRYLKFLAWLHAAHVRNVDPACRDWTRLFRLPHGTRDGELQRHGWLTGHPHRIGYAPELRTSDADLLDFATRLATTHDAWKGALTLLRPPAPPSRPHTAQALPRTADKALAYACDKAANAGNGARNSTLYAQARWLHELADAGNLDRSVIDPALTDAAAKCGLPANEIRAVLASAKRAAG